jgi:hypothetical protein
LAFGILYDMVGGLGMIYLESLSVSKCKSFKEPCKDCLLYVAIRLLQSTYLESSLQ